jgi:hypothetical protein
MIRAPFLGMNRNVFIADSTSRPLTRSAISLAFCGEIRIYLATAFASIGSVTPYP